MAKSTSKDQKSLSEKVKSLFGFKESTPLNFDHVQTEPYHISDDLIKDISARNPLPTRLKALKELGEIVMTKRLEDNTIESLYIATEDLTQPKNPAEARQTALQFYTCAIAGQLENMTILRNVFFRLLQNHNVPEDASTRLELLKALSHNGKNIKYFEEEIGPFLLSWFPEILPSRNTTVFLPLVTNVIKHNAVYVDDEIVVGFLKYVCRHCGQTKVEDDIELCLDVMDAVLCYSHLPSEVLQLFISALCFIVNKEKYSQISWKLMRNLLGTSLGHNTVFAMCNFLQNKQNQKVSGVLRGAIFFLGMALWGTKKVETLHLSPATILPSFLMALSHNQVIVAHEVALTVQRLVKKSRDFLPVYVWDIILDIVESLLKYPELQRQQPASQFSACVHDLLTSVEDSNVPYINERLYHIVESCSDKRDETSVIRLINYYSQSIIPMKGDFIQKLTHLLDKFFRNEKRQAVQLKVLQIIKNIRITYDRCFEDDAMDQALLHHTSHLDVVPDVIIRKAAIELLLEIAENCVTKRYLDILEIVEKVLESHFDAAHQSESVNVKKKLANIDIEIAISRLIKIFEKKLYTLPHSYCTKVYHILLNHILLQYKHISYTESNVKIRRLIIDFFLKIRTNYKKQVGIFSNGKVEYSVYVLCSIKEVQLDASCVPISPAPSSANVFNFFPPSLCFKEMFEVLIMCLKEEKDWITLELVFKELPKLLENKALIICGKCNIGMLCLALYTLINEKSCGPESLYNAPSRLTRTEFQSQVYPVIASLAAYHSELESHYQNILIRCLQMGLVSRSARVCIEGLTLCTLEMRRMMVKHMPAVLLKLSQISATVIVSVAMLEFLSNLIRLPPLYVSFVEDQYRSIFAIALPYTNPYKFNQYTVALAHHVIAMWFLKCRIPFRKEFAKYIAKSLRSNMSLPFDDEHGKTGIKSDSGNNKANDSTITLHTELYELGLDLMARFTFGMTSNAPKRSAIADFLLEKGQKGSWIIGNKIVTITTSGCGTKIFKRGLCEKCYSSCREVCDSLGSDDSESAIATSPELVEEPVNEGRRRHRSAFHRRSTTLSQKLERSHSTKDDILLHRQRSKHFLRRHTSGITTTVPEVIPDVVDDNVSTDEEKKNSNYQLCSCWCSGWAEIYTRRPTGNSSWMMKIQNHLVFPTSTPSIPVPAIASLLLPHKDNESDDVQFRKPASRKSEGSNTSDEEERGAKANDDSTIINSNATSEALTCPKTKVQLRRTNSSPDMNSGWSEYKKQATMKKSVVQSIVTAEEQLVCDGANNGDIFAFEEDITMKVKDQKLNQKSEGQKSKLSARFDLRLLKTTRKDIPTSTQNVTVDKNLSELPNSFRDRGHTISVMSPSRAGVSGFNPVSQKNEDMHRSGMNPSFVFLQLYHNSFLGSPMVKPYFLRQTEQNLRSLSVIDHIHPYDTHKIGVIHVDDGQLDDEQAILSNESGSVRYVTFLRGLGNLVRLSDVDQELTYVGGLDLKGYDGKFALVWHDDVMRVAFHVATLMPNLKDDLKRNNKKTHIGNNFVTIVYNESGGEYKIGTIKSQFTRACVIIRPEDYKSNVVTIKVKNDELLEVFGHTDAYIVSDESLPIFVRQMALHANLASLILDPRQQSAHVSTWLARLRAIKRLRNKVIQESLPQGEASKSDCQSSFFIDDFTDYV